MDERPSLMPDPITRQRQGRLVLIVALVLLVVVWAVRDSEIFGPQVTSVVDDPYIESLSTLNRFLSAWRDGDVGTGSQLLSAGVVSAFGQEQLREYFLLPEGELRGYEVTRGREMSDGRYAFDVRLVIRPEGEGPFSISRPKVSRVVLLHEEERWLIAELP